MRSTPVIDDRKRVLKLDGLVPRLWVGDPEKNVASGIDLRSAVLWCYTSHSRPESLQNDGSFNAARLAANR